MWRAAVAGLIGLSPAAADPLVPVPEGCTAPPQPHVVFVGEVVGRDYRSIRFEIDRVRAGDPAPFEFDGDRIDIRYGLDAQYLDDGSTYLVSAVVHPDLGLLVSRVTEPIENFGGDCPEIDDPVRTLHVDGTTIETSLLQPFFDARIRILGALLIPLAVAVGVIFALATFRLSLTGLYNAAFRPSRR
jgi:hypothetical protein